MQLHSETKIYPLFGWKTEWYQIVSPCSDFVVKLQLVSFHYRTGQVTQEIVTSGKMSHYVTNDTKGNTMSKWVGSLVPALPGTRALFNLKTSNIGHIGTNFTIDEIKYLTRISNSDTYPYTDIYRYHYWYCRYISQPYCAPAGDRPTKCINWGTDPQDSMKQIII